MSNRISHQLVILDQARRLLVETNSLQEVKSIRDKAEAVRSYAKTARLGLALQNQAARVKLLAERKAGVHLATLRLRGGDRKSKSRDTTLKLVDLGISRSQSSQWQQIAAISEVDFHRYVQEINSKGRELTSSGLLRSAGPTMRRAAAKKTAAAGDANLVPVQCTCHKSAVAPELVDDLRDHLKYLAKLLRPMCEEGEFHPEEFERRFIARSLDEMEELVAQLRRHSRETA